MEDYLNVFYEKYQKLSNQEKNSFSKINNKLLSCNYLTTKKPPDAEDYYFIVQHLSLFQAYFLFIDYELSLDSVNNVVFLESREHYNRLNLRLNESIILLILRLLYDEKMHEITLVDQVTISLGDIHLKLIASGLKKRRISKTELRQILSLFKRYHLIDSIDSDYSKDNSRIIIYPTILYAVKLNDITLIYDKLHTYQKGEYLDEETS